MILQAIYLIWLSLSYVNSPFIATSCLMFKGCSNFLGVEYWNITHILHNLDFSYIDFAKYLKFLSLQWLVDIKLWICSCKQIRSLNFTRIGHNFEIHLGVINWMLCLSISTLGFSFLYFRPFCVCFWQNSWMNRTVWES